MKAPVGRLLILGGRVVDPVSRLDRYMSVVVEGDRITALESPSVARAAKPRLGDRIIDASEMLVLPGLVDMHVHLRDPGMTEAEDVRSGTDAAAAGGFTTIVCMPNTQPVIDRKTRLRSMFKRIQENALVRVFPVAALSLDLRGDKLAQLEVLAKEGVCAFSDDGIGTSRGALLKEALKRAASLELPVLLHCEDHDLSGSGVMHASPSAKRLGFAGIPSKSEQKAIQRALRYNQRIHAKLHIQHVSTSLGIAAIKQAKQVGNRVTAEVTPHHLYLQVKRVEQTGGRSGPDPNLKMNPPLRAERDRMSLLKALSDGSLDVIASDHAPHTPRAKNRGFEKAPFGVTGLETTLPLVLKLVEDGYMNLERAVEMLTIGPAKVLGLQVGTLQPGMPADVTIVDHRLAWRVTPSKMRSRSKNNAFLGWEMKGKAVWTIVAGRVVHRAGGNTMRRNHGTGSA